jgi:Ricin-type beta-trefoil lectin domain/Lytic transglycolase
VPIGQPITGSMTYYDNAGLDACGASIDASAQYLVAVSHRWWTAANPNDDPICRGISVRVTYNGNSITVPVEDKCPSCDADHIDLSQPAFAKLAPLGVGIVDGITWKFVDSGGSSESQAPAASDASAPPPGNSDAITGLGGLCVEVRGARTADFTPVQVAACTGTSAQQWAAGSGGTLRALGKCMGVHHGATANGTTVDLYHCNNTGGQAWQPLSDGSLLNPQSGKCLDDTGWSTTPGTQLQIWSCTDAANQHWALPRA